MPGATAQTNKTGDKNQNCVIIGGGAPTILKEDQRQAGNCVIIGGGIPSVLKDEAKRPADGFKVEIEGVTDDPNAQRD